jgi:prephenate dehydrogenase
MKKKEIAIIGLGLIGGSLGMALRASGRCRVTGIGRDARRLARARARGAADAVTTDLTAGVRDAAIVVICTPVDTIAPTVKKILPYVKRGAVITDAGSVKGPVVEAVDKLLAGSDGTVFVGGHPMAGIERSGIENATAGLFRGAAVALTPGQRTPANAVRGVAALWRAAGARVVVLPPREHDRVVALVSHLPHVLAFMLSRAAGEVNRKHGMAAALAAGSFRDATRVAESNPRDWAAICCQNRAEIVRAIDDFSARLRQLVRCAGNAAALEQVFIAARTAHRTVVPTGKTRR